MTNEEVDDDAHEEASKSGRRDRNERGGDSVLDASAILALVEAEPGAETVAEVIANGARLSTVTLAETATVLVRRERDVDAVMAIYRNCLRMQFR